MDEEGFCYRIYRKETAMKEYETMHLVKMEDLNHHQTLFAARAAAWLVEAGFVAAGCACESSEGIVCRNLQNMSFTKPVQKGTLLRFLARVVYTGKSSFMVMVRAVDALQDTLYIEGMITFVTIDGETRKKREHHLTLDAPQDEQEQMQREAARRLLDMNKR